MFFLFLMIVHNNPFSTYLTQNPTDGAGLNPLLQNFYMVIHPPTMYLGFVGLTIPYAFGMAALITGYLDDSWLRAVRRWTMIAWLFLSIGLGLGMIWAYEELGWGGYWMWDPVENAGLLPWFTATAFLHSVMVQERRGMLRAWNVSLVITTFFLTLFGTFMTRSGIVQSVHSFGQDPVLTQLFTTFMVAMLIFSFGFVIYRMPLLQARNELDSWLSREAAFMCSNWILLFSAFFVLFATMFPTLSGGHGPAHHRRGAVLQPVDGADRPRHAVADRYRTVAGVAAIHCRKSQEPVPGADNLRAHTWRDRRRLRHSDLELRTVLLVRRVRPGHHHAGVLERRPRPPADERHRSVYGVGRSGRPQQTALRRLPGSCRHRADVPWLRGRGPQEARDAVDEAGQQVHVGGYDIRHDRIRVT